MPSWKNLALFLDGLLLVGGNSVICGDFNYWVDDPSSKPFSAEFVELLDLSNFENFVSIKYLTLTHI